MKTNELIERPYKYHILDTITRQWSETNIGPRLDELDKFRWADPETGKSKPILNF